MNSILFENLPLLPQVIELRRLAQVIWQKEGVIAMWLGGSFACGVADEYSDVDLRLCVSTECLHQWEQPDFELSLQEDVVGSRHSSFGPNRIFHQIVLGNGTIFDLFIQTVDQKPPEDYVHILGCRDQDFRHLLISTEPRPAYSPEPADPIVVAQIITDFWIDSLKTCKVLYRHFDQIAMVGIELEHVTLMRIWHILATGTDVGTQRPTIHGLTQVVRHVNALLGNSVKELLGLPLRYDGELHYAVEANRDEVARVGRILADRFNFGYPWKLEATVRRTWAEFLVTSIRDARGSESSVK